MTETPGPAITDAIAHVLGQVVTMKVAGITYVPGADGGTVAHVAVEGGAHEILCELDRNGSLMSARVIETD